MRSNINGCAGFPLTSVERGSSEVEPELSVSDVGFVVGESGESDQQTSVAHDREPNGSATR